MDTKSTIIAVASPPGRSARGLVRLSGEDVRSVLGPHCCGVDLSQRGIGAARLSIRNWNLPVLCMCMPGPGSYTTQDVVELQLPGNPLLLERVVDELVESGVARGLEVRRALAGEFTFRAWHYGRLSLDQAEGVAAIIAADSDAELDAAQWAFSGGVARDLEPHIEELVCLLARVESGIDFSDEEDVVSITAEDLASSLRILTKALQGDLAALHGIESNDGVPRVVLRGPANAGKSTLFNALVGRDRVVTDSVGGTTRDAIAEAMSLDGMSIVLVDTPGDHVTTAEAASTAESEADLVLWCDPSLVSDETPEGVLAIRTKCDLHPGVEGDVLAVCAFDRADLARLRDCMARVLAQRSRCASGTGLAVSLRQRGLIENAIASMTSAHAIASVALPDSPTIGLARPAEAASMLREALDHLGAIAGQVPPDDVLDRVFASFCVGK